ncbi:MAG: DapH/DapD/GlmU-related protein [Pseudomonadota bacterium]
MRQNVERTNRCQLCLSERRNGLREAGGFRTVDMGGPYRHAFLLTISEGLSFVAKALSLNDFMPLMAALTSLRQRWLSWRTGAVIDPTARVSLSSTVIGGAPGAIKIGFETRITFKTLLLAKHPDGTVSPITIGKRTFVGGGSTILPGVTIGDHCIIGSGAVIDEDVPSNTIVAGNPQRVLQVGIETGRFGRLAKPASEHS